MTFLRIFAAISQKHPRDATARGDNVSDIKFTLVPFILFNKIIY